MKVWQRLTEALLTEVFSVQRAEEENSMKVTASSKALAEALESIGPDALEIRLEKDMYLLRLNSTELLAQLDEGFTRCWSKHGMDLATLWMKYAYVLENLNITQADVMRSVVRLWRRNTPRWMIGQQLEVMWLRPQESGMWQVDAVLNEMEIHLTGDASSLHATGRYQNDYMYRGRRAAWNVSLDARWNDDGFAVQGTYQEPYETKSGTVTGSFSKDGFEIRALIGDDVLNATITGGSGKAEITGYADSAPISGTLEYSREHAALTLLSGTDKLFDGFVEVNEQQVVLSLAFPKWDESYRLAWVTDWQHLYSLQVGMNENFLSAQVDTTQGLKTSVMLPNITLGLDARADALHLDVDWPDSGNMRSNALKIDAADGAYEAAIALNGREYSAQYRPGLLRLQEGEYCITLEDVTALTPGCINATAVSSGRMWSDWEYNENARWTLVAQASTGYDTVRIRIYRGMPMEELFAGQVIVYTGLAAKSERTMPITPAQWQDYAWLKRHIDTARQTDAEEPAGEME